MIPENEGAVEREVGRGGRSSTLTSCCPSSGGSGSEGPTGRGREGGRREGRGEENAHSLACFSATSFSCCFHFKILEGIRQDKEQSQLLPLESHPGEENVACPACQVCQRLLRRPPLVPIERLRRFTFHSRKQQRETSPCTSLVLDGAQRPVEC